MKFVIKVDKALEAAERNLQEHIVELNEARTAWVEQVKAALDELKNAVDREGLKVSNDTLQRLFHAKPQDNRANYSRYIGALKLAQENGATIEMDEVEYDHLFNDNWNWRVSSKTANASYTKPK